MKWIHTAVVALVCCCPLVAIAEFGPELQMLPENTRYLMYHGLPMQGVFILSGHGARYQCHPEITPNYARQQDPRET